MGTYKVIQDIEAEDKLFGWMTMKQFIFFAIACVSVFITFWGFTKGFPFLSIVFVPIAIVAGLLAAPFSKVQPTEVWLAAQIRFYFKPRKRVWNQTGIAEMVTITVPKKEAGPYSRNLTGEQVQGRLQALAKTMDSRGWAVKNVQMNAYNRPMFTQIAQHQNAGDRLISAAPRVSATPDYDVKNGDDMLDPRSSPVAARLDQRAIENTERLRNEAISKMRSQIDEQYSAPIQPVRSTFTGMTTPAPTYAAAPTIDITVDTIQTPPAQQGPVTQYVEEPEPLVVAENEVSEAKKTVIMDLSQNNDFSVATLATQAKRSLDEEGEGEVTIKLR
jgi:PrgI family protein